MTDFVQIHFYNACFIKHLPKIYRLDAFQTLHISSLFDTQCVIRNILKYDNFFMFDTPKFCYLWMKSLKISIYVLIIHLSKYSNKKFYFACLHL